MQTLRETTSAIASDDATYKAVAERLSDFTGRRNAIASRMIRMIENAEFGDDPLDENAAKQAIDAAQELLAGFPVSQDQ